MNFDKFEYRQIYLFRKLLEGMNRAASKRVILINDEKKIDFQINYMITYFNSLKWIENISV